jgi:uncharacterized membrane protein YraQ (UPF0718 family)
MDGLMKKYIKKFKLDFILIVFFGLFVLFSYALNFTSGIGITGNFLKFFIEMISFLPLMFILIGLFDVWFPKEKIEKHIGQDSGFLGTVWVILLAMLQAGPLYVAFPVAYLLWIKGSSIKNIFIYLGAFSTLKIPMLMFEIGFLGLKFSLLRTIITLPVFIIIGYLMEYLFRNKNFEVKSPK